MARVWTKPCSSTAAPASRAAAWHLVVPAAQCYFSCYLILCKSVITASCISTAFMAVSSLSEREAKKAPRWLLACALASRTNMCAQAAAFQSETPANSSAGNSSLCAILSVSVDGLLCNEANLATATHAIGRFIGAYPTKGSAVWQEPALPAGANRPCRPRTHTP